MKAISTKIYAPTATLPGRISAGDSDGNRITLTAGQLETVGLSLSSELAARYAARELCRKMHWEGRLASGWTRAGYVFVFVDGAGEGRGTRG